MIKTGRLALVALTILALPARAQAPDIAGQISTALAWISANSDYKVTEPPRFVSQMTAKQIADYAANRGFTAGNAVAMFDCASGTMFLNSEADYEKNLWNRGVLVHELVHHAQCANHQWGNLCSREGEAYALQVKFLNQHLPAGNDQLKAKNSAWAKATTEAMCRGY